MAQNPAHDEGERLVAAIEEIRRLQAESEYLVALAHERVKVLADHLREWPSEKSATRLTRSTDARGRTVTVRRHGAGAMDPWLK